MSNSGKWLRVRVTDLRTGASKANVKIPVSLADFGMKMAASFAPSAIDDLDMNEILTAMKSGGEEKFVEIEDEEKDEHIEIFIE
ncbi:MAG TPA: hypothetical protein VFQ23_00370 [Anaerolineales bacterium]|nr:hypothetical protein [Anaerolineales bacterium]